MKVAEVMKKYHKLVPFPVTVEKIRAAGFEPTSYLAEVSDALGGCSDFHKSPGAIKIAQSIDQVRQLAQEG